MLSLISVCTGASCWERRSLSQPPSSRALAVQLHDCDLSLRQNESVVASGTGANALGHPAMALAHLADVLAGQPEADPLEAGEIITTGTLTPAMPIRAGETWRSTYAGIALAGLTVSFSGA